MRKNKHNNVCLYWIYSTLIWHYSVNDGSRCEQRKSGKSQHVSMKRGPTILWYVSSENVFCVFLEYRRSEAKPTLNPPVAILKAVTIVKPVF